uniref:Putative ovule protein n=1 Tax=Solanum chacoense TaxID=4108 RepID=A0A0V0I5S6_SOLCH
MAPSFSFCFLLWIVYENDKVAFHFLILVLASSRFFFHCNKCLSMPNSLNSFIWYYFFLLICIC